MVAWKEACSMRRCGREPSRMDLASYFASALDPDTDTSTGIGAPKAVPQVRTFHWNDWNDSNTRQKIKLT